MPVMLWFSVVICDMAPSVRFIVSFHMVTHHKLQAEGLYVIFARAEPVVGIDAPVVIFAKGPVLPKTVQISPHLCHRHVIYRGRYRAFLA